MKEVEINKNMKLSEHFGLAELTKTSYHLLDGNIPSHVAIENLRNICENWLEDLRATYNKLYVMSNEKLVISNCDYSDADKEEIPVVITSGYRSEEVNRLCGGAKGSNHLTGCAVDIRCMGPEQLIRYSSILLDIADGTRRDFDELIHEKRGSTYWLHFAVRPKDNRRKILFDMR
ncbi:MAG: hypothetical protein J5658_15720 [Prevotella sp.]|nr:hypothetical protein [Prevotella sp.]